MGANSHDAQWPDSERDDNQTGDEESDSDSSIQASRPGSPTRTEPTNRESGNETEEQGLLGFGTKPNTGCVTVGKTTKDKFINGYGKAGFRIYKIEHQPSYNCDTDKLSVINGFGKQLGMLRDQRTGKYKYNSRNCVDIFRVAIKDNVADGLYGPESLDPDTKGDRRWTDVYIWVGWRDPADQEVVRYSWETRTTARRLWGQEEADRNIYNAAWRAHMLFTENAGPQLSRDETPGLLQEYIQQQRQQSAALDPIRQSSVTSDIIRPSIEIGSDQNQSHGRGIRSQPNRAGGASMFSFDEQRELKNTLVLIQQALSRMSVGL